MELKRTLGLTDATMIVAGSMIGSGVFIVSADMARTLGSSGYLMLSWIVAGIATLIAALSYGELAGMMPQAGGQYIYIQRAFGKITGFVYGWTVFTVIQTGVIAAVAVAFAKFASVFVPQIGPQNILFSIGAFKIAASQLFAILLIIFLTFINSRGVRNGKLVQAVFTSAKLLALLALVILGIYKGSTTGLLSFNFADAWSASSVSPEGVSTPLVGMALLAAFGVSMVGSLFSSDAWNNVTFIAGEIKNPGRNIPRSLIYGTLIVTVLYLLANLAYLSLLPLHGLPAGVDVAAKGIQFAQYDRVGTAAASVIWGNNAVFIMAFLIMISTFGCNNGIILSGARLYYAMAKDGLFFKRAATLNKNEVPGFALWIQCIWASLLCLSGTYGDLLDYVTFASLIFYIITIAGIFVLRKKEPNADRPYKAWGYPILPMLYIVFAISICIILLIFKTQNTGLGLLIVLIGIPVYYIQKKFTATRSNAAS